MTDPELRDLPGLRQWGDELRHATSRAEEQPQRPRTRRRRVPVRRLGVALAAMFLLVPGAVATRSIWDSPVGPVAPLAPQPSTPAVRLAEGRTSDAAWRVGGYDGDGGQRCLQLDDMTTTRPPQGGCAAAQTPAQLTVVIATLGGVRFVIGTVATQVASVEVVVPGGRRVRVPTTDVPDEVRRRAGMGGAFRVYVAPFAGGFAERPPPGVSAYDADGRVVGSVGAR